MLVYADSIVAWEPNKCSEISVCHGSEYEDGCLWVVVPCSLVEVY
jgi:hypothetical protein